MALSEAYLENMEEWGFGNAVREIKRLHRIPDEVREAFRAEGASKEWKPGEHIRLYSPAVYEVLDEVKRRMREVGMP